MKKIFEDMVPGNRRSIREIELPNRTDGKRLNVQDVSNKYEEQTKPSSVASLYGAPADSPTAPFSQSTQQPSPSASWTDRYQAPIVGSTPPRMPASTRGSARGSGGFKKVPLILLTASIVSVVAFFAVWTFLFAKVKINVTPLSHEVTLNQSPFTATKGTGDGQLSYDIITLTKEGTKKVAPSGERQVQRTATGKVVLYNEYSTKPQRLVRNTRLETPDGLIFRISDSVTIPGKTTVGDTETPGSITVAINADTAGDKYNISASDFTIPGFKGDPRYTKFYAKSTESMTRGFIGTEKVVSDDILHTTQAQVQTDTLAELTDQVKKGLTADQIMYDSSVYSETEMLPAVNEENMVVVTVKVTLYAATFSKSALAKAIAKANITPFDNSPVTLDNPDQLTFTIVNKDQIRPWIDSTFNFTLSGKTKITWQFDEEKLRSVLVGQPKQTFYTALPNFPSIGTATPHFSPAWRTIFPQNPKDIEIVKSN